MSTQIASLYADIGARTTGFEAGAKTVKRELAGLGASSADITKQNAQLLASVAGIVVATGAAIKSTLDDQLEYANSVRTLANVSDISTESASRFIQVLDDYKISAQEATAASRFLKNQGLVPNIETLARLSDQYLAIQDPAQRLAFAQENLGRNTAKWTEILEKGSASLLAQNDAIADNLILTQKMVDDARKAEIAIDQWDDSVEGLKTTFAVGLLPVLTDVTNHFNDVITAFQEQGYWYAVTHQFNLQDIADRREQANALMLATGEVDANTQSLQEQTEALQEITDINRGLLSVINDIQSVEENYHETKLRLAEERLTIAADDIEALDENTRKVQENEQAYLDANLSILSALAEQKLMQDGMLTDDEINWLIDKRVEWGIYSAEVADKARAVIAEANNITASIANIPTQKTVTITFNQIQTGMTASTPTPQWTPPYVRSRNATGVNGVIPSSYGNEGFMLGGGDSASGGEGISITPRGKTGNEDVVNAIRENRIDPQNFARIIAEELMRLER